MLGAKSLRESGGEVEWIPHWSTMSICGILNKWISYLAIISDD